MSNHLGVPGYSVQQVGQMLQDDPQLLLLDVRETQELALANLGPTVVHAPMSELAARGLAALPEEVMADKAAEIIVFCHHGVRSAQVTAWLRQNGFSSAMNMDGGIDAFATLVDASVGVY